MGEVVPRTDYNLMKLLPPLYEDATTYSPNGDESG